jgi:hypothetical protein
MGDSLCSEDLETGWKSGPPPYRLKLVNPPHHTHFEILRSKLGCGEFGGCK